MQTKSLITECAMSMRSPKRIESSIRSSLSKAFAKNCGAYFGLIESFNVPLDDLTVIDGCLRTARESMKSNGAGFGIKLLYVGTLLQPKTNSLDVDVTMLAIVDRSNVGLTD